MVHDLIDPEFFRDNCSPYYHNEYIQCTWLCKISMVMYNVHGYLIIMYMVQNLFRENAPSEFISTKRGEICLVEILIHSTLRANLKNVYEWNGICDVKVQKKCRHLYYFIFPARHVLFELLL